MEKEIKECDPQILATLDKTEKNKNKIDKLQILAGLTFLVWFTVPSILAIVVASTDYFSQQLWFKILFFSTLFATPTVFFILNAISKPLEKSVETAISPSRVPFVKVNEDLSAFFKNFDSFLKCPKVTYAFLQKEARSYYGNKELNFNEYIELLLEEKFNSSVSMELLREKVILASTLEEEYEKKKQSDVEPPESFMLEFNKIKESYKKLESNEDVTYEERSILLSTMYNSLTKIEVPKFTLEKVTSMASDNLQEEMVKRSTTIN